MRILQVCARLFLALWLALAPVKAWAGSMTLLGAGKVGAAPTPFSITYGAIATNIAPSGNVFTFSSVSIPNSDPTRTVYVGISQANCTTACGFSSVTINGIAATQATGAFFSNGSGASALSTDFWYAACGTSCGTTTNIVVTTTSTTGRVTILTFSVLGTGNAFSSAGGSASVSGTSGSATLTVPSGGGTIGFGAQTSGTSATFTNLTSAVIDSSCCGTRVYAAGIDTSLSGSNTFTITYNGVPNATSSSFVTISP